MDHGTPDENVAAIFETAENYMAPLMTLRDEVVQDLLERCHSVKVKRVFLYLAEKLKLPVFFILGFINVVILPKQASWPTG